MTDLDRWLDKHPEYKTAGKLTWRVAQKIADRVNEPGQCSYNDMAKAAIGVVTEACAQQIERSGIRQAHDLAAAIRRIDT